MSQTHTLEARRASTPPSAGLDQAHRDARARALLQLIHELPEGRLVHDASLRAEFKEYWREIIIIARMPARDHNPKG